MTFKNMEKDIEKAKARLRKKQLCENFGTDESRKLRDKYFDLQIENYSKYCALIGYFEDWCADYTGGRA